MTCFAGITSSVFFSLTKEKQDFILSSLVSSVVIFTYTFACLFSYWEMGQNIFLVYALKFFIDQCCSK